LRTPFVEAQLACEFYHPSANDDIIEIMLLKIRTAPPAGFAQRFSTFSA